MFIIGIAGITIGLAAIAIPQWDAKQKASKAVVVQGFAYAPNGYDTLIENPSTTTYRVLQVHFKVEGCDPPDSSLKAAPIPTGSSRFYHASIRPSAE